MSNKSVQTLTIR